MALYALMVLVLALIPVAARSKGLPVSEFTRDVFSIASIPVYAGVLSNLGVFLWCAAAAVGAFGALVVEVGDEPGTRRFLIASAGLSVVLMIDDFFMVHEWLVPRTFGWPEEAVYGFYGLVFVLYAIAYRRFIRAFGPALFGLAAVLLAVSVGIDLVETEETSAWGDYIEDGFKWLGIGSWLAFIVAACAGTIRRRPR